MEVKLDDLLVEIRMINNRIQTLEEKFNNNNHRQSNKKQNIEPKLNSLDIRYNNEHNIGEINKRFERLFNILEQKSNWEHDIPKAVHKQFSGVFNSIYPHVQDVELKQGLKLIQEQTEQQVQDLIVNCLNKSSSPGFDYFIDNEIRIKGTNLEGPVTKHIQNLPRNRNKDPRHIKDVMNQVMDDIYYSMDDDLMINYQNQADTEIDLMKKLGQAIQIAAEAMPISQAQTNPPNENHTRSNSQYSRPSSPVQAIQTVDQSATSRLDPIFSQNPSCEKTVPTHSSASKPTANGHALSITLKQNSNTKNNKTVNKNKTFKTVSYTHLTLPTTRI